MKTIRRFASGIFASVEWLADQVENHEALVTAAIRDVEKATARANVQFKRVQLDGKRMRQQLQDLRTQEERWEERAKRSAESDRDKALECLRRRKKVQAAVQELEKQERGHAATEKSLAQDLIRLNEQLQALKQKRNIMRSRETQAHAMATLSREDSRVFEDIDAIFDRWETNISSQELHADRSTVAVDALEFDFEEDEQRENLSAELDELLNA